MLRQAWATNFMRQPGADLRQLKRESGWAHWEVVDRYSHAIPIRDRDALPNALHKPASSQPPVGDPSAKAIADLRIDPNKPEPRTA